MNFDLRFPIGLLFSFYGALLSIYGLATNGSDVYKRSLDININIEWGLVMLLFGVAMLWMAWRSRKRAAEELKQSGDSSKRKLPSETTTK
ncbi:MAG: hypothetical protein JWR26_3918 [Pedosphaera sp.]|nr:hypothetical protein [Pedosphaera sp.]